MDLTQTAPYSIFSLKATKVIHLSIHKNESRSILAIFVKNGEIDIKFC